MDTIINLAKVMLSDKQLQTGSGRESEIPITRQLICASKRNRNLRDMLVRGRHPSLILYLARACPGCG